MCIFICVKLAKVQQISSTHNFYVQCHWGRFRKYRVILLQQKNTSWKMCCLFWITLSSLIQYSSIRTDTIIYPFYFLLLYFFIFTIMYLWRLLLRSVIIIIITVGGGDIHHYLQLMRITLNEDCSLRFLAFFF